MSNETPPFQDYSAVRAVIGFGRVPDAVDAAIERHRAAREDLQRATGGVDAAMTVSQRAEAEAEAVFSAASNADGAAWADLLATRPGDVPGAVRLLRYVSDSPASEVVEDPQDLLRQLLAVVEAAETGERQGDRAPAAGEPLAAVEPDPALAVVAEFRAAWDELGGAIEAAGGAGVPEVPEAEAADSAAYARLRAVRPTTPAGFRALAETWAWRLQAERIAVEDGEPGSTASHAADSLIAGAGACLPGAPAVSAEDWAHTVAGGLPHADGTVTYWDVAGEEHRKSVAHWIGFVAMQLHCRAQIEMTRRREAYGDPPGEEIDRLEAQARRELRLDALSDLAFRPDRVFAAAEALRTGQPEGTDTPSAFADPVHALIKAHRAAYAEWDRMAKAYDSIVPGAAGYDAAGADERASGQRERTAYDALFQARPTTVAGVLALADYLGEAAPKVTAYLEHPDHGPTLAAVTAALRAIVGTSAHPDAALLALGDEFMAERATAALDAAALVSAIEAEWRTWAGLHGIQRDEAGDAAFEASCERRDALLDTAEALPGSAQAVRHAKALARAWVDWVEDERPGRARGVYSSEGRLVFDIHASLSTATGEPGERLRAAPLEHDLTGLPVEQLGHLYDALLPFEDPIGRAENAPCFWEGEGLRTVAGDIIYREAARLEGILKAIAKEIESRAPTDDSEREIRLATLLRHRMLGGGLPTSRALLTEALAACED